jgi:hypothetical protein
MYITAPKSISTAYFINTSHQPVCLYAYHPIVATQRLDKILPTVARQRLGKKRYRGNEYTRNNMTAWRVVFCAVRVVSRRVGD